MRPVTTAILVIAGALMSAGAARSEPNGPVGAGATRCSDYLAVRAPAAERDVYAQWASGLIVGRLSAVHHFIPEQLTVEEVARQLQAQCVRAPEQTVLLAALRVAAELGGK